MSDAAEDFDVIVVGTGFASSFFLVEHLRRCGPRARILVLERGPRESHLVQLERRRVDPGAARRPSTAFVNKHPTKQWVTTLAFGGNSNCWWACTPRFLPEDFTMASSFGVSESRPISDSCRNTLPSFLMETTSGSPGSVIGLASVLGKSTGTPTVKSGAVIMKMTSSTSMTSTSGVTLISWEGA